MNISLGNLLGLVFAIGIIFSYKPLLVFTTNVKSISSIMNRLTSDDSFEYKAINAVLSAAIFSILIGFVTRNSFLAVVAMALGLIVGMKIAESNLRSRASEYVLRLRIASGAFIDVVSLCVASGIPFRRAIAESSNRSTSEVQDVWKSFTEDQNADFSASSHLLQVSLSNNQNVMGRISRTLLISLERGTSITQTLQSLSSEIRSETRRQLLEIAAKKEVAMMIPVVFGILPSITAIALYPAFVSLSIM